jgi:p-cumate 2,3-dioxygenase alpha subunit
MNESAETYIVDDQMRDCFGLIAARFTDPECLENERRRIFEKCWIYVGHESEVPHAGDFHRVSWLADQ